MIQNVALFPGNISYEERLLAFSSKIRFLVTNKQILSKWQNFKDAKGYDIEDIVNSDSKSSLDQKVLKVYPDLIRYVLNDSATYHILRRKLNSKSLYELDLYAERVIFWSIDSLFKNNIDCVIHHHTPHEVVSYIFSKVAEFFEIPIYVIRLNPIPWRVSLQKGWISGKLLERKNYTDKEIDYAVVSAYLDNKLENYSEAIPEYEKERFIRLKGKFWSWKKEIKEALNSKKNPIKSFYALYLKFKLYQYFKTKISNRYTWGEKFVTFYLSYQPERTTLPEGDIFNQQLIAIRLLRSLLPKDISLVVKEHPSTYRNSLSLYTRSKLFYSRIVALDNVYLCSLESDTFELLDDSLFISTISGSVAIEASARNKCTVYFGDVDYKGLAGSFSISSILDNTDLIYQIIQQKLNPTANDVKASFDWYYTNSFCSKNINIDEIIWDESLEASTSALVYLLSNDSLAY